MADQFDLEQGIMSCWHVTDDLDTLLEEIIEGDLTKDQISNVVLGMSQLYNIKFEKLFRTFEGFLKSYYNLRNDLKQTQEELRDLRDEVEAAEEANLKAADVIAQEQYGKTLDELFLEEEQREWQRFMDEQDQLALVEDEEAPI